MLQDVVDGFCNSEIRAIQPIAQAGCAGAQDVIEGLDGSHILVTRLPPGSLPRGYDGWTGT